IVRGEEGDPASVDGAEAGRRVGDALADDGGDDAREQADADPPHPRRTEGAVGAEPRPDDEIGASVEHWLQDLRKLARVVLPVTVDLAREVVAAPECEAGAGLHRGARPDVERQAYDMDAAAGGDRG